jgi:hypothetical protein
MGAPSAAGGAAAAAGAPAVAVLGIRQALERGRGTARSRRRVPRVPGNESGARGPATSCLM